MVGISPRPLWAPAATALGYQLVRPVVASGATREQHFGLSARLGLPQQQQRTASNQRRPQRRRGEMAPSVGMAQMQGARSAALISFRIPHTFVPPPMRKYLGSPKTFAKLLWYRVKSRMTDTLSELSVRLQSKPGFFQGGRFKPNKKALVPLAQTMHAQMLEATAAGDLATLGRLLTNSHMDEVAGLIARRPRGRQCRWELLSYLGRPRLVDSKVVMIPGPTTMFIRQAVVEIRSRQRFTWTADERVSRTTPPSASKAATAAPSVVEKDVTENIVLVASLDRNTWETSEWRIFGFLPQTTVESWEEEVRLVEQATKDGTTIG